ncbi:MAG: hemerythrin domain-containing protein [Sandaracinus sp.]|nr:hemerythrin domain-containing protein [Sandaracinus sp.]
MSLHDDLERAHHEVEAAFDELARSTPDELRHCPPDRIERARILLERHFADEELHLFPRAVDRHPEQIRQLLDEHDLILRALATLRELAARGGLTRTAIAEVGSLLVSHRWREERLFRAAKASA